MCGIVGYFSSSPLPTEKLDSAIRALHHRGPDGSGSWFDDTRQVALGHARLSIIDLHTGDQPLFNEDRSLVCVVNGELYGYQAIRKDLESKGHRFATQSDSEILLHAYEEDGERCFEKLRGEFAFLLYDLKKRILIAGRDRFGIKPLFYADEGGKVCLASEIKALLPLGVTPRWDYSGVFHAFHYMSAPPQAGSLFKGIKQVPPGHFLRISANSTQIVQYWDFNYPDRTTLNFQARTEAEYIEGFREIFRDSVKLRLQADVPVACYLSGGLDSCAVLGMASTLVSKPIQAFTLGFDRDEYDETPIAKEMAEKAGAPFHSIPMRAAEMGNYLEDAIYHCETLVINPHAVAKFLLSRAVNQAGYKVVLTGEGSDEILGGYVHFRRDMLLYNQEKQDRRFVEEGLKALLDANQVSKGLLIADQEVAEIAALKKQLGYVPSWIEGFSPSAAIFRSVCQSDFIDAMGDPYENFLGTLKVDEQLKGRDPVNQSLYLWSKSVLPNYILTVLGDRMEMAHSIEGRVAFLDHKLVEYVVSMPISMKIKGMTEKYVLREALKPELTDTVYRRQKHPFLAPPITADTRNPIHDMLQDTLRSQSAGKLPFVDQTKLIAYLDRLPTLAPSQKGGSDPALCALFSAVVLQKRFNVA